MNISKLSKFAGVFFALAIVTTSLFAQGKRNINETYAQNSQVYSCIDVLPGLTEDQISAITELEEKHQERMAELRNERRSTINFDEKDLIREEMLENLVTHRSEVKKLLNAEQQKEYEILHLQGNNFRNRRAVYQSGNGNFQGRGRQGFSRGNYRGNRGSGYGAGAGYRQRANSPNYRGARQFNNSY